MQPISEKQLDRLLDHESDGDMRIERHETGPEWIVYATAGLVFLKSAAELLTSILKARAEGKAKGDKSQNDVELIVRGLDAKGKVSEEHVLRISTGDPVKQKDHRAGTFQSRA